MRGGRQQVVFGRVANQVFHSFRHTDELGLDREEVTKAILTDLSAHLPLAVQLFIRTVIVRGVLR